MGKGKTLRDYLLSRPKARGQMGCLSQQMWPEEICITEPPLLLIKITSLWFFNTKRQNYEVRVFLLLTKKTTNFLSVLLYFSLQFFSQKWKGAEACLGVLILKNNLKWLNKWHGLIKEDLFLPSKFGVGLLNLYSN